MKIYVKQMHDWNDYAYFAEDVDEQHWGYFRDDLWWQIGSSFLRAYDNVPDFEYCAKNFAQYGEVFIRQQLKLQPAPWEAALERFACEMEQTGVDWYVHGSAAMALWRIDVAPKDVNVIIPNASDFDKIRNHFYKLAVKPIERCEQWIMSGLGTLFLEAGVGISFHNRELEPFDLSKLSKTVYHGRQIFLENLEDLKRDNQNFGRPERVKLIEERMRRETA